MQVDGALNGVRRYSGFAVYEDRVPLQHDFLHEIVNILLFLNDALGHDLSSSGPYIVQVGVPELTKCLPLEPLLHYEQTVYHASFVLFPTGLLCGLDDSIGEDWTVWFYDLGLVEFAGYNLFQLVLESQRYLSDFFSGDGRGKKMFAFAVRG